MNYFRRELSITDGIDVYDMLQEIGPGENGFVNDGFITINDFAFFLNKYVDLSKGMHLRSDEVPVTMYWLYVDGKPIGYGKLRHCLNDRLRKIGGHIGYAIRPTERGKGYGTLILGEILKEAKKKDINEVSMTCMEGNTGSRKVIEGNKGILESVYDGECYYSIIIN